LRNEKLLLLTLGAINFTHVVDFMIMMPLGPALMRIFAITPQNHAALVSAYTVAAGITGFVAAFAIDRFDRKKALFGAYLMFTLGTLACAFAPSYEWLLFTRAFAGSFGGVLGALVLAIVGDVIPLERRATAMGIVFASFSVGSVIGVPFSLFLANRFDWHAPFLFVAALSLVVLFMIAQFMPSLRRHLDSDTAPETASKEIDPIGVLQHVWRDNNQLRALALTFFTMLSQFSMIPFLSPYMVSNMGLQESDLPWIYFFGGGATIFTAPWVGRMADRFGKIKVFTVFSFLVMTPILAITHAGVMPMYYALMLSTLFFIFSNGRFIPSSTMTTSVVTPEHRGSFMSLNSSVQNLSAGVAAYMGGLVVSTSADGRLVNYHIVGYMSVVFVFLALLIGRRIVMRD